MVEKVDVAAESPSPRYPELVAMAQMPPGQYYWADPNIPEEEEQKSFEF